MATKRIKSTQTVANKGEFDRMVDEIARLEVERRAKAAARDARIQAIQDELNPEIDAIADRVDALLALCDGYARDHREEVLDKTSKGGETPLALYGYRFGQPTLKTYSAKWTWGAVIEALKKSREMEKFVRTKEEPDKDALKKLDPLRLAEFGMRITQSESFWVEPKTDAAN